MTILSFIENAKFFNFNSKVTFVPNTNHFHVNESTNELMYIIIKSLTTEKSGQSLYKEMIEMTI